MTYLLEMFQVYELGCFAEQEAMENGKLLGIGFGTFGEWVKESGFMQV